MKKIAILGSTGSIGKSALQVAHHLSDAITVTALAAHSNIALISEQIRLFNPQIVALFDEEKAADLRLLFPHLPIFSGMEGLERVATHPDVDFTLVAMTGMQALLPTISAIKAGKTIGLANKEILASAGELIRKLAEEKKVPLIPIDSEHSAIFQCLEGRPLESIRRVILTASGGPFRNKSIDELGSVKLKDALAHPTWSMGPKITVDSSTLMNKGLEMIEARWLFNLPPEKIEVVIHPQSIIHSMVEFIDGSILAQLSEPNMIYPIQYALTYPERKPGMFPPFDFTKNNILEFFPPDYQKFPALSLAHEVLERGGSAPCYLNAINEVLVERFLKEEISWSGIVRRIEKLLGAHKDIPADSVDTILMIDHEARKEALAT